MAFGNPLDFFNAGVQGGQVSSPAYGVGNAIRGMLDQANKRGLIQEQAAGNLLASMGAEQYKTNIQNKKIAENPFPTDAGGFVDPATGKDLIRNYSRNKFGEIEQKISGAQNLGKFEFLGAGTGGRDFGGVNDVPPPGIDPADWAAATPEEKQAFLDYQQ